MNPHARPLIAAGLTLALAGPAQAIDRSGSQAGTWRAADSPHVVTADVLVPPGQDLVLEAGCVVLVEPGAAIDVAGNLIADGTPAAPVRFASRELQPRPGDWQGLRITGTGVAWLGSTRISHAVDGIVAENGAGLDAQDLTVSDSLRDGVVLAEQALGSLVDARLERNGDAGLVIRGGAPLVLGAELRLNGTAARMSANAFPQLRGVSAAWNRELDGMLVDTAAPVTTFGTWTAAGMPYVFPAGATLRIDAGAKLGLEGGAVLKFGLGAGVEVAGDFSGGNTGTAGALLTSLADDAALGDTNRDGAASPPGKGDWNGLAVVDGGVLSFTGAELRLADDGVIVDPGGRVVLYGSEIHSNQGRGVGVGPGGNALIDSCSFHDNDVGVQVADTDGIAIGLVPGNGPTGGNNSFHCNATFDVENGSAFALQAWRNYWGSTPPDAARFLGPVDAGEFLIETPAAALVRTALNLGGRADGTLRFDWSELSSCARYQLASAETPAGPFGPFTAPTAEEFHEEPGGLMPEGTPVRYFVLLDELAPVN